jgi:NAD dependent epimerase/dehydratase family enzyme
MVMSPDAGGIFATLLRLARVGLGGAVDGGRQYVSWIHERDFVRSLYWLMDHESLSGAVNIAAPHPLPYRDFMRDLRRAAGVPIGLPATRWMLALGTWALRTEAELVLKSRRVVARRLAESGFGFEYPEWSTAANELVRRSRRR